MPASDGAVSVCIRLLLLRTRSPCMLHAACCMHELGDSCCKGQRCVEAACCLDRPSLTVALHMLHACSSEAACLTSLLPPAPAGGPAGRQRGGHLLQVQHRRAAQPARAQVLAGRRVDAAWLRTGQLTAAGGRAGRMQAACAGSVACVVGGSADGKRRWQLSVVTGQGQSCINVGRMYQRHASAGQRQL